MIEICLGLGPCGELRYPAYQEAPDKWSYMGRGDMSVQSGASRAVLIGRLQTCTASTACTIAKPWEASPEHVTGLRNRHPGHRRVSVLRPLHAGGPAQDGRESGPIRLVRSSAAQLSS